MKLERQSAGGLSEAEERAAWVLWGGFGRPLRMEGFGRGAAGFAGGGVGAAEAARREAREIASLAQERAISPMAASLPLAKLRARARRRFWRVS